MRLKLALLTTALAFGLGTTAALAEDAPGAKSDITIVDNSGAANVPAPSPKARRRARTRAPCRPRRRTPRAISPAAPAA